MSQSTDDVLGLDNQLKVTKRTKIAKVDQERLLGKNGVSYIAKNYHKVNRIIRKNDHNHKSVSKSQRYDVEHQNLSSVLQFYQLWCHTMFPRAKFYDCVKLVRGVTNRSPMLRQYRRELIEAEISKLRGDLGVIDVPIPDVQEPTAGDDRPAHSTSNIAATNDVEEDEDDYHVEDDFSFMTGNALFVDPDEEIYNEGDANSKSPSESQKPVAAPVLAPVLAPVPDPVPASETSQIGSTPQNNDDESMFSDEEQFLSSANVNPTPQAPVLEDIEDDYDEELAVMNELGM